MMVHFYPVQTWVGNKRRKLASKVEQNGGMSHSLSSHGLAGGLLSNHTLAGGALSSHGLVGSGLLPVEIAAARNIQNRLHLLPPATSFPSFSSASSSPSSSSPISSGSSSNNNNNNNDVILTGIYSLSSVPRSRQRPTAPPSQSDSELTAHTPSSLISQALQSRSSSTSSPLHSKLVSLSQCIPSLPSASGPLIYAAVRKGAPSHGEAGTGIVPHNWTRQYGTTQTNPGSSSSKPQTQLQSRPHSSPQPPAPAPQKTSASPVQDSYPRIQQAFSLTEVNVQDRLGPSQGSSEKRNQGQKPRLHPPDTIHSFSIAMETGNEEDEWQREEELANMAAQTHIRASASPNVAEVCVARGSLTPPTASSRPTMLHNSITLQGSYSAQTSITGESGTQVRRSDAFLSFTVNDLSWVYSSLLCRRQVE